MAKPAGARVQVRINKQNKRGLWRCSALGFKNTTGTVEGVAPANAEAKQHHWVEVVDGNDAGNLVFRWPQA